MKLSSYRPSPWTSFRSYLPPQLATVQHTPRSLIYNERLHKAAKPTPARQIGYTKVFEVDTIVRAGCTKSNTAQCGISYRGS